MAAEVVAQDATGWVNGLELREALVRLPAEQRRVIEMLRDARRIHPDLDPTAMLPQESQIVPTELDLAVIYLPGTSTGRELARGEWARRTSSPRTGGETGESAEG